MKRLVRKFPRLGRNSACSSVILCTFGIILLVFFLRNVESGASVMLLFSGALLLGLSNVLAFLTIGEHRVHFFFVLFVTTFFLLTMFDTRFGVLQGSDIVWEYTTAKITLKDGAWLLTRAATGERYFSSASISLFPAVVSRVAGLDLIPIFQWILRFVLAFLPLVIFQTVQEIFGNIRLSALSALIFSQFYFNFNLLNFLVRQGIAEIFLVLTIFSLVKLHKAESKRFAYVVLVSLSIFGLVVSHYTLNYWSIILVGGIFATCFLVGNLPKKLLSFFRIFDLRMEKPIIDSVFLILFVAVSIVWIYFTNLIPFLFDVHNELYLLAPSTAVTVTSTAPQSSWFFNNPAGPVVGFWFDFTAILIPIGFFYMLFRMPKQSRHMPWVGGGLVMLAILAFWVVAGSRALGLYLDRILTIGALFFTTFMALCVLLFDKKLKVFAIVFLLINLPVNMVLPSYQRYVLYRPEESVFPRVALLQRIIRVPEFTASIWLDRHAKENLTVCTDFFEEFFYVLYNVSFTYSEAPPINSTSTFFLLHYYNLRYGLWQAPLSVVDFPVSDLLNNSCIIYNNGDAAIIARMGIKN